jgi:hypothetical protein
MLCVKGDFHGLPAVQASSFSLDKAEAEETGRQIDQGALMNKSSPLSGKPIYLSSDVSVEIRLTHARLSISGTIWNKSGTDAISCGQVVDEIRDRFKDSPNIVRLCQIWDLYHLNDMRAGSPRQMAFLKSIDPDKTPKRVTDYYTLASKALADAGLNPDQEYIHEGQPYKYGKAWLMEEIPGEVLTELRSVVSALESIAPQVKNLAERNGISIECLPVHSNPNMEDSSRANNWSVKLAMKGKTLSTFFSMGKAHVDKSGKPRKPTAIEVLGGLGMDARFSEEDLEEFCACMDLDSDSNKARQMHDRLREHGAELRKFLGDDLYEELVSEA